MEQDFDARYSTLRSILQFSHNAIRKPILFLESSAFYHRGLLFNASHYSSWLGYNAASFTPIEFDLSTGILDQNGMFRIRGKVM